LNRINVEAIQIVDDDGCVFPATQTGGAFEEVTATDVRKTATMEVNWFRFEAFPRRDRQLRLRVYEYSPTRKLMAEVKIPNPAPLPRQGSVQTTKAFPITNRVGGVSFVLKGMTLKENYRNTIPRERLFGHPSEIVPDLEVSEGGQPVADREALDFELRDGSGNFASKMYDNSLFLCPKEDIWKLRVKYFGGANPGAEYAAVWKLTGLKVPAPGTMVRTNATNVLQGVPLQLVALCGPGIITYSNNVLVGAAPLTNAVRKPTRSMAFYSGWPGFTLATNQITNVHLAFELGAMSHDQRLTVTAKDDQGRIYQAYAYDWDWGRPGPHYVYKSGNAEQLMMFLDLPEDAKTVDLTIAIRRLRVVEFIFRPPQPGGQ
jgi:hypothetical protein